MVYKNGSKQVFSHLSAVKIVTKQSALLVVWGCALQGRAAELPRLQIALLTACPKLCHSAVGDRHAYTIPADFLPYGLELWFQFFRFCYHET